MEDTAELSKMVCYSVGHSTYSLEEFIELLIKYNIDCIVDVRSIPYSQFASQYNKESLEYELKKSGILYLFMGEQLGARYEQKELLMPDGKVDFDKVRETQTFQEGIKRILTGMGKGYTISTMCSEKEPFDCHRFVLVSKSLQDRGVTVKHITPKKLVPNYELEERLFKKYKFSRHDLFHTEEENLSKVYRQRNMEVAYNAITKEGDEE